MSQNVLGTFLNIAPEINLRNLWKIKYNKHRKLTEDIKETLSFYIFYKKYSYGCFDVVKIFAIGFKKWQQLSLQIFKVSKIK